MTRPDLERFVRDEDGEPVELLADTLSVGSQISCGVWIATVGLQVVLPDGISPYRACCGRGKTQEEAVNEAVDHALEVWPELRPRLETFRPAVQGSLFS